MHATRSIVYTLLCFGGLVVALPVSAGIISGTLRNANGTPLGSAEVKLTCGNQQTSGLTDKGGNYRLAIAGASRCTLTVKERSATVLLSRDPVVYDFKVPVTGGLLPQ